MNLILCSTPLQLKIAIRIIEEKRLNRVTVLFTGIMPNKRNSFYLDKIEKISDHLYLFDKDKELTKSGSYYLNSRAKKLVDELKLHDVQNIYLANLNQRFYHHLLSVIKYQNLYTFDDGTENVNSHSHFYRYKKYSAFRRLFQSLFGRRYWMDDVLKTTKNHYTIYNKIPNVVERTTFIPLYQDIREDAKGDISDNQLLQQEEAREIKILVGSVYRDMVKERKQAQELVEELNRFLLNNPIDLYIPHPRDEENYFESCKVLIPDQMVEEIVISYLKSGYSVSLFGFGGSGQLNLDSVENVKNYLFTSEYLSERTLHGYQLFQSNCIKIPLH